MAGSASEKDKENQRRNGKGTGLKLGLSLVRAKKYIDADGMYARKDKGNMGLRDYTCKRGQIDKIYYNWVRSVVRDALVVAGIRTPTPVQLYGPLAEINQEWSPNHDLPENYNLKDAFRLISAKTSTNTVLWGNLSPLKQREIVKYIRERAGFLAVTSGDWLYEELVIDVLANIRSAWKLAYDREVCRLAGIKGQLSKADIATLRSRHGEGPSRKSQDGVYSASDTGTSDLEEEEVLATRNRTLVPKKRGARQGAGSPQLSQETQQTSPHVGSSGQRSTPAASGVRGPGPPRNKKKKTEHNPNRSQQTNPKRDLGNGRAKEEEDEDQGQDEEEVEELERSPRT
ncbi:BQ5605_C006g04298 [Microbotryum silenes-dioicae]|uniref:BQ5605_C006g04298 protein n=1 Tax=Microbotryum silenes-dioicae TaxID=796604 RepID=A0A2X0MTP9_9BASI|nr:BQ5605_C006g04298 [Microbotryum silenes-dioicae]